MEKAMVDPATVSWGLSISSTDFEKLKAGFESSEMEDKWTISVENLEHSGGKISITFMRSWTGQTLYKLTAKPSDGSGATIETITWERNKEGIHISEEQGKKEVVIIARLILDCDFDELPYYHISLMWDHSGASINAN
jgi:hypothetical protein